MEVGRQSNEFECVVKKPVPLRVGDTRTEFKSGCFVVDVLFPGTNAVDIGQISFKNSYTAFLTVKAKIIDSKEEESWICCVKRLQLMPHPHYEAGSQDFFTLSSDQMDNRLVKVMMLRLVLQQPSPHWKNFGIEELKVRPCVLQQPSTAPSPLWLALEEQKGSTLSASQAGKISPNVEKVSTDLQQLWAMTAELKAAASDVAMGRFDVNGCYDINLLSYT